MFVLYWLFLPLCLKVHSCEALYSVSYRCWSNLWIVGLLLCFPIEDAFLAFCPIILGCANQKMLCMFFFVCVVKRKLSQIQWTMAMGDGNGRWHWAMAMLISQQLGLPDYSGRWWVGVQLNWLMDMSCPDWCWTNRNYWHQGQASSSRIGSSDLK